MTRKTTAIILSVLFSFLFSSNSTMAQTTRYGHTKLEEITARIAPTNSWKDIFLKITEDTKTKSSHIYLAKGLYNNRTVGLQIEVGSNIDAGIVAGKPDSKAGFVANAVQLKSIGAESDEFIKALAVLYKQPASQVFSKQIISANAFSLNEKAVNLDKNDQYKLKLFFAEEDEDLYSEVFMIINTTKREIEINEKDLEYRKPIIKVLTN